VEEGTDRGCCAVEIFAQYVCEGEVGGELAGALYLPATGAGTE